jgi:hypothetical protein
MSDAIDAQVALALAAKATQVFTDEETLLSFPLAPIVYRREALQQMLTAETAEGLTLLGEFSRLVNLLPTGAVWSPVGDRYLWDVYGDVLEDAELASARRTPEDEAEFQRVWSLLHAVGDDGLVTDSAAMIAYRQCRDAWMVAQQEYANRRGTAEASSDPALQARWAADEPVLSAQVQESEHQWQVDGRRAEIEEAQRLERQLTDRSPAATWAAFRKFFDPSTPEIFFASDPTVGRYVPTALRPSDALEGPWARMTLGAAELAALADAAPAELRDRLPPTHSSDVVGVTFEYLSVSVQRPWFTSAVFASRAWRFADQTRMLSDGAAPPQGECPAYVAALVLARNLAVTHRRTAPTERGRPVRRLNLGFARLDRMARPTRRPGRPGEAVVRDHRTNAPQPSDARRPRVSRRTMRVTPRPGVRGTIDPAVLARLRRNDFRRRASSVPVLVAPASARAGAETTDADHVYVLGFICRTLAQCPDPDVALAWPRDTEIPLSTAPPTGVHQA